MSRRDGVVDRSGLASLLNSLQAMRVHQSADAGPARKKPILVLLLAAIIAKDARQERRFQFNDVRNELARLIEKFGGRRRDAGEHPEQPFYHLGSEPFWTCVLTSPKPPKRSTPNPSSIDYGELTDEAFRVLKDPALRSVVVDALVSRWWPPDERPGVLRALGL